MAVRVVWEIRGGLGYPPPEGEPELEEGKLELKGCGEGSGEVPEP